MGCRQLHFQLLVEDNLRALDRRVPDLLECGMQIGSASAERGFRLGDLTLHDLPLAEPCAGIARGLRPG